MNIDVSHTMDSIKEGTKEVAETAQTKTSEFHENYVSKVIPDLGKYGDAAKFVAEMAPGVSEYNAIREGDWQAFAIAAGLDVAALAVGAVTAGSGYAAVKGGSTLAKTGVKTAAKEVAEAGAKKIAKETAEAGAEKVAKELAEAGAEKAAKELAEAGAEKAAKELAEAGAEKVVKEVAEAGAEKAVKEVAEAGAEKAVKEVAEAGTEKAAKEVAEADIEKLTKEYLKDIKVKSDFADTLSEAKLDISKLEIQKPERVKALRLEFQNNKASLRKEWEKLYNREWPKYKEDVFNEVGIRIRKAGDYLDAHHFIPLQLGGTNVASNITPLDLFKHREVHSANGSCTALVEAIKGVN